MDYNSFVDSMVNAIQTYGTEEALKNSSQLKFMVRLRDKLNRRFLGSAVSEDTINEVVSSMKIDLTNDLTDGQIDTLVIAYADVMFNSITVLLCQERFTIDAAKGMSIKLC